MTKYKTVSFPIEDNTQACDHIPCYIINQMFEKETIINGLKLKLHRSTLEESEGLFKLFDFDLVFPLMKHPRNEISSLIKSYCKTSEQLYVYLKNYFQDYYNEMFVNYFKNVLTEHSYNRIQTLKPTFTEFSLGLALKNSDLAKYGESVLDNSDLQQLPINMSSKDIRANFVIHEKDLNRLKLDPTFYNEIYQYATEIVDSELVDLDNYIVYDELYYKTYLENT